MGWKNVDRALSAHVEPPAAHLLLIHMARVAHDNTGRYYAGIGWLIIRMHVGNNRQGERRIYKLLAMLTEAGHVKPDGFDHGRRVYVLTLPDDVGNGAHPDPESTGGG